MKKAILLIPALVLGGCFQDVSGNAKAGIFTPNPPFLKNLPQGDDSFSLGFREGCYNAIGQEGYGMMRMFDKPVNYDMASTEKLYVDGYRHGDRYCSAYVNKDMIL
jgi:hypothetical protein